MSTKALSANSAAWAAASDPEVRKEDVRDVRYGAVTCEQKLRRVLRSPQLRKEGPISLLSVVEKKRSDGKEREIYRATRRATTTFPLGCQLHWKASRVFSRRAPSLRRRKHHCCSAERRLLLTLPEIMEAQHEQQEDCVIRDLKKRSVSLEDDGHFSQRSVLYI